MRFEYFCEKCNEIIEQDYSIGQAPKQVKCDKCGCNCERHYGSMNFILKGGGWPGKLNTFNEQQTKQNERAARKMWKERNGTQPKLVDQR